MKPRRSTPQGLYDGARAICNRLTAIDDASGRAFALWVSFLTVVIYLAIAVGTTTRVQLLLATPAKLPLLSVDLSLCAFYVFAPPLFLGGHLYVLVQLYFLLHLRCLFNEDLKDAGLIEKDRKPFPRRRVKSTFSVRVAGRLGVGQEGSWA